MDLPELKTLLPKVDHFFLSPVGDVTLCVLRNLGDFGMVRLEQ